MPTRHTESFESFTYEGALGWSSTAWLFAGLALLIGWLMWKERTITGPKVAGLLFSLRLTAIALVLWMLLGPTHLSTERTTIPQTLAIIVDSSQSMDVAEPLPTLARLRWAQAIQTEAQGHEELASIDKALVALRHANATHHRAITAVNNFVAKDEIFNQFEVVSKSSTRSAEHLLLAAKALEPFDQVLAERVTSTAHELKYDTSSAMEELTSHWQKQTPEELTERFDLLSDGFDLWLRQTERYLQETITLVTHSNENSGGHFNSNAMDQLTRKELSARTLQQLEATVLHELAKRVNIKRIRVDEIASLITKKQRWEEALDNSTTPVSQTNFTEGQSPEEKGMGPTTNLTAVIDMLHQGAAAESIVMAIIFSDGGHNAPGTMEPLTAAAGLFHLPIHTILLSNQEAPRDLSLNHVRSPSSVGLNDKIVIEALVTGSGAQGEATVVELRSNGEVLQSKELEFDSHQQDHRVRFTTAADTLGQHEFDLVVVPLAEEMSATNNSTVVSVRVVRDSIRVLLADRITRWEYRYLDNLFRRDKHVKFDKLLFSPHLIATGNLKDSEALPRDVEGWAAYDVVILGDLEPSQFDFEQQESLAEWVEKRGGNLIVIAGNEFMPHQFQRGPFVEMLPVQELPNMILNRNGYLPRFTQEGSRNEALMLSDSIAKNAELWAEQFRSVPCYYLSSYCYPKPAAHVLMEAAIHEDLSVFDEEPNRRTERALISWQNNGAGSVVYIASPITYHLRFRRGDELHHRFWGQLLRWVTAAERGQGLNNVFIKTANARYEVGQSVEVIALLTNEDGSPVRGAKFSAQANSPTGEPVTIPLTPDANVPGRYFGTFDKLQPGTYRISAIGEVIESLLADKEETDDVTTLINVISADNVELSNTQGNRALLRELAEITGGQVIPPTAVGEILELSALAPRVIENSKRTPLWNKGLYLWLIAACLAGEWGIRRWIGLV